MIYRLVTDRRTNGWFFFFRYAPDGNTIGVVETPPPVPIRLQWDLENEELTKAIDTSFSVAQKLLNDVDLRILMYTKYGKGEFLYNRLKKGGTQSDCIFLSSI